MTESASYYPSVVSPFLAYWMLTFPCIIIFIAIFVSLAIKIRCVLAQFLKRIKRKSPADIEVATTSTKGIFMYLTLFIYWIFPYLLFSRLLEVGSFRIDKIEYILITKINQQTQLEELRTRLSFVETQNLIRQLQFGKPYLFNHESYGNSTLYRIDFFRESKLIPQSILLFSGTNRNPTAGIFQLRIDDHRCGFGVYRNDELIPLVKTFAK
jgi:hypothetical protein